MEITYQTVTQKDITNRQIVSLQGVIDEQVEKISFNKLKYDLAPMLLLHRAEYEHEWGKTSDEFNIFEKDLVMKEFRKKYKEKYL